MEFIDLKTQYIRYKADIDARIQRVLDHGHYIMGPEIEELETTLANFVGVKHCITVANGTVSLEIALRALGVGPGDEVITVPFSWISSAEVIPLVGATPVFVDITPDTYLLDPNLLEAAITKNTKAIIAVSLYGQMPDLEAIQAIASKYGIAVIEDGAQSFGATRNGKRSCGASLIGSTSFFPAKPLGCYGDGGALFTDDDTLADSMRAIRTHGGLKRHHHTHVGMNGRFDTLQAAVLLAKFPHFEQEIGARQHAARVYTERLRNHCEPPIVQAGNSHVYAQYTIRLQAARRDAVISALEKERIPFGIYYPKCLHEQPIFSDLGYEWGDFSVAETASRSILSLPMHPFLEHHVQHDICKVLEALL